MAKKDLFLTTGEFASKTGIATSSVTRLIRTGKIAAEKKSGKWLISPDQLKVQAVQDAIKTGRKTAAQKAAEPVGKKAAAKKSPPVEAEKEAKTDTAKLYSVAEFAAMTYLTEFGVKEWLKQGRLTGQQVAGGDWQIEASNLESPDVKRLVR